MRIIKPGNPEAAAAQQATCRNCEAVVEFLPAEVPHAVDRRKDDYFQFPCPCCGASIFKAANRREVSGEGE